MEREAAAAVRGISRDRASCDELPGAHILPRQGCSTQGNTVVGALHSLGFEDVHDVHIGRHIVVHTDAPSTDAARETVRSMCERLLANPVIEDFDIVVHHESLITPCASDLQFSPAPTAIPSLGTTWFAESVRTPKLVTLGTRITICKAPTS